MVSPAQCSPARDPASGGARAWVQAAPRLILPALVGIALFSLPAVAETVVSAEIQASATALISDTGISSAPASNSGSFTLGVDTERNDAVKASASVSVNSAGELALNRAWMKARMPWLIEGATSRLTVGLAPLSWGKGFLFNAGDPIFGELPAMTSLSGGEYRTATAWLAAIYLPLGAFSFAEAVYLPPIPTASSAAGDNSGTDTDASDTLRDRAGGRVQMTVALPFLQSVEAGWLHDERDGERGYLAADGSLWADWYAAAAFVSRNPADSLAGERVAGPDGTAADWSVSGGLFRIFDFTDYPLTCRLEGLAHPALNAQNWFGLVSLGLGDIASAGVQGLYATGSGMVPGSSPSAGMQPGTIIAGLIAELTPVKGFTLSAQALRRYIPGAPKLSGFMLSAGALCKY